MSEHNPNLESPDHAPEQAPRPSDDYGDFPSEFQAFVPGPPRRTLFEFIIDRNPFYLLSAVCMLHACLTLTNSDSWVSIPTRRLLVLIATLNVYEILLVLIAAWLIARRGQIRDGVILLAAEAVFVADAAFLNHEILSANMRLGLLVNLGVLLLAIGKLAVIFHALAMPMLSGAFAVLVAQVAMLMTMPAAFKWLSDHNGGRLQPLALYATWWVIGLVPVALMLLKVNAARVRPWRSVVTMFVACGVLSIVVHLCTSNWVYKVRWQQANLAPLALGLAVAIGSTRGRLLSYVNRRGLHFVLPIVALYLSQTFSTTLQFSVWKIDLSPLRLAVSVATIVYLYGYWLHRHIAFAAASAFCASGTMLGATASIMGTNVLTLAKWAIHYAWSLVPRTRAGWGVASLVGSFALLVLGVLTSLVRPRVEVEVERRS